jgi:hypothetical protein
LALELGAHRVGVIGVDRLSSRLGVPVQADGQARVLPAQLRCVAGCRPFHHQAGAGHDPSNVAVGDRAVDALGQPEVVRVDDQMASHATCSSMAPSTFVASK